MAVATHCPYCAFQCALHLHGEDAARATLSGDTAFPVNRGRLCVKGFAAAEPLSHPDRLRTPLVRNADTGELEPMSWPGALAVAGRKLSTVRGSVGVPEDTVRWCAETGIIGCGTV